MVIYVLAIILIAFVFDFINGFHDSANSIATIVGTRVLSPLAAVIWAATFNFAAVFLGSTAVAKAVSSGFVVQKIVTPSVICAGLLGAIIWNLITWYYGIPSSSSHALIGGYAGAAVGKAGFGALLWGRKWIETLSFIAAAAPGQARDTAPRRRLRYGPRSSARGARAEASALPRAARGGGGGGR